ncbi:MAG: hypothetical protein PUC44_04875 [Eubacteriales bacterium]|nr:hypothetical protein [Eubacteriales bacterium]
MELNDFTEKEQNQIEKGLSEAKVDKKTSDKIMALVPQEWVKKIPFFVRKHAVTKTIEKISREHSDLYAAAERNDEIPEKEREELRQIVTDIFKERMAKHNIK